MALLIVPSLRDEAIPIPSRPGSPSAQRPEIGRVAVGTGLGETIRFRTTFEVRGFGIDPQRRAATFRVSVGVPHAMQVQLRHGGSASNSTASATSERPVPAEVLTSFNLLSRGYLEALPDDYDSSPWVRERVSRDLVIASDGDVPIRFLPQAFRAFMAPIEREHFEAALRVVGLSRWVYGIPGQPQPLRVTSQEFSREGDDWARLPYHQPKPSRPYITQSPFAEDVEVGNMQDLIDSGATESVGRSLWLEASVLRYSNPRSALVAAVAAVELALKTTLLAHGYKPKKRWPPLQTLLREELVPLSIKATVPLGVPVLVPTSLVETLRSTIDLRNDLAHEGKFELTNEQIDSILDAVENFVWLADFYRGFRWTITKVDANVAGQIARASGFRDAGQLVRAVLDSR